MPPARLIVISAPSGSGKTTIVRELRRRHPELEFSVSATTRPRRPREVDGKDYLFLNSQAFQEKMTAGELVEWEEIYGDYYGTPASEVERALKEGKPMIFDVDVKGALSIKKRYPQAVLVFIKPPSIEALKERLMKRRTETEEALRKRLDRVHMELEQERYFDFSVVNEDVDRAVDRVEEIAGLKKQA
jgi:guanylate kinase